MFSILEIMPVVMPKSLPPVGNPNTVTRSPIVGKPPMVIGAVRLKKLSSSTCNTAKSYSGERKATVATYFLFSLAFLTSIKAPNSTTCAQVRIKLPSMIQPDPEDLDCFDFCQG